MTEDVIAAFIKYSSYYTKVSQWLTTLEKPENKDHPLRPLLRKKQRENKGETIKAQLITGVQRPPRYSLLLRVCHKSGTKFVFIFLPTGLTKEDKSFAP